MRLRFSQPSLHLKTVRTNLGSSNNHLNKLSTNIPTLFSSLTMTESKSNDKTTMSLSEVRGVPNLAEREKEDFEAILHSQKSSWHHHDRETHGLDSGIDENTSLDDVKAPNVFERAKEEFQALAQVFHHKKEAHSATHDIRDEDQMAESRHKQEIPSSPSEKKAKASNIFVRAKEEIKAVIHHHDKSHSQHHHHHKETHGRSDDIVENTPTNEVKGPNVYERVKEEIQAVFHHDKSQHHHHHRETHGRSDDIDENTPNGEVKGPNVYQRVKEEFQAVFQAIHPKKES